MAGDSVDRFQAYTELPTNRRHYYQKRKRLEQRLQNFAIPLFQQLRLNVVVKNLPYPLFVCHQTFMVTIYHVQSDDLYGDTRQALSCSDNYYPTTDHPP